MRRKRNMGRRPMISIKHRIDTRRESCRKRAGSDNRAGWAALAARDEWSKTVVFLLRRVMWSGRGKRRAVAVLAAVFYVLAANWLVPR